MGHDLDGKCEFGHGQYILEEDLELIVDNHKIVITSDGKTTLARLYEGREVVKSAEANCSPDDEFDFTQGAKIAFERLTEAEEYDYHKVFITLQDYCIRCDECKIEKLAKSKGMLSCSDLISFADIEHKRYSPEYLDNLIAELESFDETDKPEAEAEKAAEKPFVPHLEFDIWNFGEIGKDTNYMDSAGHMLCVGDVVELIFNGKSYGDTVIVEDDGNQYVMGIMPECNSKNGSVGNWKIFKKRSFKDVKNGETIHSVKFILGYYSGKVVCVESDCDWWTAGKIYEVVNGDIFDDMMDNRFSILNLPHLNDRACGFAKFIELKE